MIQIEQQYDDIYTEYYRVIHVFAIAKGAPPHIAEEIASETFTRLWEKRNECQFNELDDRVNEKLLKAWLYRVAENVIHEFRRKVHYDSNFEELANTITEDDNISDCIEDIGYREYIAEIEQKLTEDQLTVFRAMFVEKLSYKEAQAKLKIKGTTLRSTVSRLRKLLRPYIDNLIQKNKNKDYKKFSKNCNKTT